MIGFVTSTLVLAVFPLGVVAVSTTSPTDTPTSLPSSMRKISVSLLSNVMLLSSVALYGKTLMIGAFVSPTETSSKRLVNATFHFNPYKCDDPNLAIEVTLRLDRVWRVDVGMIAYS